MIAEPDATVTEADVGAELDRWLRVHALGAWTGRQSRFAFRDRMGAPTTTVRVGRVPRRAWRGWRLRSPGELVEGLLRAPLERAATATDQRLELLAVGMPVVFVVGADDGTPTHPRPGRGRRRLGLEELQGLASLVATARPTKLGPVVSIGTDVPLRLVLPALDRRTRVDPGRFPSLLAGVPHRAGRGPRPATLGALVDVLRLQIRQASIRTPGGWFDLAEVRRAA
ncbi:MAG: hypothetical protein R3B99_13575 [Polyangiales bacterium]|nr:hypothetical protein [Myxococcales bacterium]MCB9601284.1 hypothetical protein [Sandaracinus sp.]